MQRSGEKDFKGLFYARSENILGVSSEVTPPTASHVGGKGALLVHGNMNWGSSQTYSPKPRNSLLNNIHISSL